MRPYSDFELIEQVLAGNRQSYATLVDRHQQFVISVAIKFLGDLEEAKDVGQEVFVVLWQNLTKFNPEFELRTWLYTITSRRCLDVMKSSRYKKMERSELIHFIETKDSQNPHGVLADKEFVCILLSLVHQLPAKQKAVFVLAKLEGIENTAIAEMLDMSTGNVKSLLYYACLRMTQLLSAYYEMEKEKWL